MKEVRSIGKMEYTRLACCYNENKVHIPVSNKLVSQNAAISFRKLTNRNDGFETELATQCHIKKCCPPSLRRFDESSLKSQRKPLPFSLVKFHSRKLYRLEYYVLVVEAW